MSSYNATKLKDYSYDVNKIKKKVENLSARAQTEEPRKGTDPESFRTSSKGCYFEYVEDVTREKDILGETKKYPDIRRCGVAIL